MGVAEQLDRPLARVVLTRMDDPQQRMEAQFNPDSVREVLSANYARLEVPGLSHEPLQFRNTRNLVVTMTFFFNADSEEKVEEIDAARRFLLASLVPRIDRRGFPGAAPPDILLSWPNTYQLIFKVISVSNDLRRFRFDGRPITIAADVTFEESRASRITADEVAALGTIRGGSR